VHFDLLAFLRNLRASPATQAAAVSTAAVAAPVAAKVAEKPAPAKAASPASVEQAAERLADEPKADSILLEPNFEGKTSDQIEGEARQREQEAMKKAATPSADAIQAALEERRKRLLGGKQE